MSDYKLDYWSDCLGDALESIDAFNVLTDDQKKAVARHLMRSAEMMSECFGSYNVPDPWIAERRKLEESHKRELAEANQAAEAYKLEGCRLAGVNPNRVWTRDGEVWVSSR